MVSPADIFNARILIVDDQLPNVQLLERAMRGAGFTSITSTMDPYEVCELYRKNEYDLILLDLEMPGLDGFQVMKGLKDIVSGGELSILVVTAQPAHKLRALQAGAKDFVSKPMDLVEVLTRAKNMIEVHLLHTETIRHARMLEQTLQEVEENRLRMEGLISSAMDAIISVDVEQRIILFNAAAQKMFQYAPSAILGEPLDILIPERHRHNHVQHIDRFSHTGVTSLSMGSLSPVSGRRADGEEFPIEASISQVVVQGQKIFTVFLRDITDRIHCEKVIRALEMTAAEERERDRLAHLLHDDLQQILVGALYRLHSLPTRISSHGLEDPLKETADLIEQAIETSRQLSHELSPPTLRQHGLVAALYWQAERMQEMHGLKVKIDAVSSAEPPDPVLNALIFRFAQELLFNVVKHAGIREAHLSLALMDNIVELRVQDQGRGFNTKTLKNGSKAAGFGLLSIYERASLLGGKLDIKSTPGEGSVFTLTMPLDAAAARLS